MAILARMTLGEKILKRRKELKLSQQKLAAVAGISQPQISELENKEGGEDQETRLTLTQLKLLADALMVPADYLIDPNQAEAPTAPIGAMEVQVWRLVRRLGPEEALDRLVLTPDAKRRNNARNPDGEDKPASG